MKRGCEICIEREGEGDVDLTGVCTMSHARSLCNTFRGCEGVRGAFDIGSGVL